MAEQSSKEQKGKAIQNTETPDAESAELQAALAHFAIILDKTILPPNEAEGSSADKSSG